MRFTLTHDPILSQSHHDIEAGGVVSFEGRVRRFTGEREVAMLSYEACSELAIQEGNALLEDAIGRFGLLDAIVVHRLGEVPLGETAVQVVAAARHRREAFAACEWIIDQLKCRVPIWKRESFCDGTVEWVGAHEHHANECQPQFFQRQISMEEIGIEGQNKLLDTSVLIVGVGGLGCGVLPHLVGAGIGRIGIVDPDEVDRTNLHRQTIYRFDEAGRNKAERAGAYAQRLRPDIAIDVYPYALSEQNVNQLVASYDWVVECTDSLDTKFLLNAACKRHQKPLVTASVHRFDGYLMTIDPDGPCLNCLYPEQPVTGSICTCAEVGVLGLVPACLGVLQANEVLKGVLGYGQSLSSAMITIDFRSGATRHITRSKRQGCLGCNGQIQSNDISVSQRDMIANFPDHIVIDIRDESELPELPVPHVRMKKQDVRHQDFESAVLICCAKGIRSEQLVRELREQGCKKVYSLKGGVRELLRLEV